MAERPTVLLLGDLTAAGTRPRAELLALDPTFGEPQPDARIWNVTAAAWQPLHAGVNTDPLGGPSDRWAFEARLRDALRPHYPAEPVYFVKHAVDSTLLQHGGVPAWDPRAPGELYDGLLAQLRAAATAAHAAGDVLRVVGVVSSILTRDWRSPTLVREVHDVYLHLIEALRVALASDVATTPHCLPGSIRGTGPVPWVALAPHYGWDAPYLGFDFEEGALHATRMRIELLETPSDAIRVLRTHGFTTDQLGFDARSLVAMAPAIVAHWFPATAPAEATRPVEDVVCIFGDSIAEGTGDNAALPGRLQRPQRHVRIWNAYLAAHDNPIRPGPSTGGDLQLLHVGQNNNASILPYLWPHHGPEPHLADLLAPVLGRFTICKGAVPGTLAASANRPASTSVIPPHTDRQIVHWDPTTRGQYADLFVGGWLRSTLDALRDARRRPRARLVLLSLGSNDIVQAANFRDVGRSLRGLIRRIRDTFAEAFVDTGQLKFSLGVPRQSLARLLGGTQEAVDTVRADVLALADADPDVTTVDFDEIEAFDGIHFDSAASRLWVERALAATGLVVP